jgi:hypothetical protein
VIENASSKSTFVKLLQGISMTSQFHNLIFFKILLFGGHDDSQGSSNTMSACTNE